MAAKTQALAFLDAAGVPYELLEYAAHTDHFGIMRWLSWALILR